jgi:hypothetical protein
MGATAFRPRISSRRQYKARRAARLRGRMPKGRDHEVPPWYTFNPMATSTMAPRARLEHQISRDAVRLLTEREFREQRKAARDAE